MYSRVHHVLSQSSTLYKRSRVSDTDLQAIAKACNTTFEGIFTLMDTGKQI